MVQPAGAEIEAMLAAFDLTGRAAARPGELSEGERARLAVAGTALVFATHERERVLAEAQRVIKTLVSKRSA